MVDGQPIQKPSFGQNLSFMFRYQLGHMYFRYFMWNFSGRQNDIQGHGDFRYGNWISGIPFIDNILVGDQSLMPDTLKHDKANNKYYMLPFILGLLGMFYQYQRGKQGKKDFWVVMLLFFFTGIAIVLYLNQYPYQPRERDYAYAGSFYAFCHLDRIRGSLLVGSSSKEDGPTQRGDYRHRCLPVRCSGKHGSTELGRS